MNLAGKRALSTVGVVAAMVSGAAAAQAAVSGTFGSVSQSGNYLSNAKYNFHAAPVTRNGQTSYLTNVSGSFVVTNPTAHLNTKIDGYGWTQIVTRSSKATVPYSWNLGNRADVLVHSSVAMQNCRDNAVFPDNCSSTTKKR